MDVDDLLAQIKLGLEASRSGEGHWVGMAAFRWGFPLIEMYRSRYEWHVDTAAPTHLGAANTIHHTTRRAEPRDTYFVTPIVDAPYSRTFVDLAGGPVILHVPPIDDRYYTVQLLDMYTNSFAYVGTSQGDTVGGDFLLAGPGWTGDVPDSITRVVRAPGDWVCLLARVSILDDDVPATVALQQQIQLRPATPGQPRPRTPGVYSDFRTGDPLDFYRMLAAAVTESPPAPADAGVLGLLQRIGLRPHQPFDPKDLHPKAVDGLRTAVKDGLHSLYAEMPFAGPATNGWVMVDVDTIGNWGVDYYSRFEIAQIGLLANAAAEAYYIGAVFDTDGRPLSGDDHYEIRFGPDDFPPVDAFWSITMYTNPQGFLVENDADVYHLGSLSKNLSYGPDGSLTLYLQREDPGPDRRANWLPCTPPGQLFRIILRQYLPRQQILRGRYAPPGVRRTS